MQVFISWSGERSKAVAELLDWWLQCVLQRVTPWMSQKDIDRGSMWFSELTDQLKGTTIGVVCLTKDNLDKPWILFEAGALAKGLTSSRVCTLLIDLEPADISDPLAQFNHARPDRDGVYLLVRTLNKSLGEDALQEKVLDQVFETYWPQFQEAFDKALEDHPAGKAQPKRKESDMVAEILGAVRSLDRRMRSMESGRNDERLMSQNHVSAADRMELRKLGITDDFMDTVLTSQQVAEKMARAVKAAKNLRGGLLATGDVDDVDESKVDG